MSIPVYVGPQLQNWKHSSLKMKIVGQNFVFLIRKYLNQIKKPKMFL